MSPTAAPTTGPAELTRFSPAERAVHAVVGVLVVVLMATAAALYLGPIAVLVGHRNVVATLHVWTGLALPVPVLAGLVSVAYRLDLGRLNRFGSADGPWLRSKAARRHHQGVGKFNAGQKLNTALSAGAMTVLLGSGVLMYWPSLVGLSYRTGATFVHDVVGLAFGLLVLGHVGKALQDREALRGIWRGRVGLAWARRHHPAWALEAHDGHGRDAVAREGASSPFPRDEKPSTS